MCISKFTSKHHHQSATRSACPSIRDVIFDGIDKATVTLHYNNDKPRSGFFCPHSNGNGQARNSEPHAATTEDQEYWQCTMEDQFGELTEKEKVWFGPKEATAGTEPTLPDLLKFTCTDGRVVSIPVEVATKYVQFGTFLLDDRNGSRVKIMVHEHLNNAEQVNIAILQEWLIGRGKKPMSWTTLVKVLRDIELSTLAGDIEAVKYPARPFSKDPS